MLTNLDFHLQTGNLGYKTGLSFTNGDSWVTNGILGLLFTVKDFKSKYAKEIRSLAGLDSTPQLIVYVIDKDSKAVKGFDTREDLNSVEDIVGICMNIPGGKRGTDYTATVSIHMQNNPFDDEGDLEGTNEN